MALEAEKPPSLSSASWRPRTAGVCSARVRGQSIGGPRVSVLA